MVASTRHFAVVAAGVARCHVTTGHLLRDSLRGEFGMATYILRVNSLWNVFIVYKNFFQQHINYARLSGHVT